ncbi:MAG: hypothetical protein DDT40_01079 [candidate division WS2 bacterium]|nr:hypothetical protein [Candidatus Psychracetigena formicireducens]
MQIASRDGSAISVTVHFTGRENTTNTYVKESGLRDGLSRATLFVSWPSKADTAGISSIASSTTGWFFLQL